jgi:hypothetical protein
MCFQGLNTPEFWEVADRPTNMEYLPRARRLKLEEYRSLVVRSVCTLCLPALATHCVASYTSIQLYLLCRLCVHHQLKNSSNYIAHNLSPRHTDTVASARTRPLRARIPRRRRCAAMHYSAATAPTTNSPMAIRTTPLERTYNVLGFCVACYCLTVIYHEYHLLVYRQFASSLCFSNYFLASPFQFC